MYKVKRKIKLERLNARWEYVIFVGVRQRSNEIMVAVLEGIMFTRAVKRVPREMRWGEDNLKWVKWAPWHKYKGAEDMGGEVPGGVLDEERGTEEVSREDRTVVVNTRETAPRELFQLESGSGSSPAHGRVQGETP